MRRPRCRAGRRGSPLGAWSASVREKHTWRRWRCPTLQEHYLLSDDVPQPRAVNAHGRSRSSSLLMGKPEETLPTLLTKEPTHYGRSGEWRVRTSTPRGSGVTVVVIRAVLVLYLNRVRSGEDDLGRGSYRIPVVATGY